MVAPLSQADRRLLAALEPGLEFTSQPYQALAEKAGMSEEEVLARLRSLQGCGTISGCVAVPAPGRGNDDAGADDEHH